MSELKTLKNFEYKQVPKEVTGIVSAGVVAQTGLLKELRQEAIKWIKELRETMVCTGFSYGAGKVAILMAFFNLTEKEIKENK